jgi:hypothetical protein
VPRDLLEHLDETHRVELGATERARLEQPEKPVLDQRRDQFGRKLAASFDLVRRSGDPRPESARSRDVFGATGDAVSRSAPTVSIVSSLSLRRSTGARCATRENILSPPEGSFDLDQTWIWRVSGPCNPAGMRTKPPHGNAALRARISPGYRRRL